MKKIALALGLVSLLIVSLVCISCPYEKRGIVVDTYGNEVTVSTDKGENEWIVLVEDPFTYSKGDQVILKFQGRGAPSPSDDKVIGIEKI
jgi:hypothetical protein